jgi:hypothetical protein
MFAWAQSRLASKIMLLSREGRSLSHWEDVGPFECDNRAIFASVFVRMELNMCVRMCVHGYMLLFKEKRPLTHFDTIYIYNIYIYIYIYIIRGR